MDPGTNQSHKVEYDNVTLTEHGWIHVIPISFDNILLIIVNYTMFPLEEYIFRLTYFLVATSSDWDALYFGYHSTHIIYFGDTSFYLCGMSSTIRMDQC